MYSKTKSPVTVLVTVLSAWALSGCNLEGTALPVDTKTQGQCTQKTFTQPKDPLSQKLDILFVVDTSGSLDDERQEIAENIENLIVELPGQTHYRLAVMLAHSDRSKWGGKLFSAGNVGPVFDSQKMSTPVIQASLLKLFEAAPSEVFTDGGETLLYSLYRGLEPDFLALNKKAGFFRDDAGLVVIFVSDENDICAAPPKGALAVADPENLEAAARKALCGARAPSYTVKTQSVATGEYSLSPKKISISLPQVTWVEGRKIETTKTVTEVVPGEFTKTAVYKKVVIDPTPVLTYPGRAAISPALVWEKLVAVKQNMPIAVSTVAYSELDKVVREGENELGYGLIDVIQLGDGVNIDLGNRAIAQGLGLIGNLAQQRLKNLKNKILIEEENIDPATLKATVDEQLVAFNFNANKNEVVLENAGDFNSDVKLEYCLKAPAPLPPAEPECEGFKCGTPMIGI